MVDDDDARVPGSQVLQDAARVVGASVVDEDDLVVDTETLERRAQETRLGAIGAPRTEAQDAAKPDA
mgnify:CR=1 FL=1